MKSQNIKTSTPPKTPERKAFGELKIEGCVNLGQLMAAAGPPVTNQHALNMEKFGSGYGYAIYETNIWGGGTQNLIVGDSIRDRALIFIDAKYATTIEQPSTEAKAGISLSSHFRFFPGDRSF